MLLVTSAYTANLASFFVARRSASGQIATIADAVRLGKAICTLPEYGIESVIRAQFQQARLNNRARGVEEMYQFLHDGDCAVVATLLGSWSLERRDPEINVDCDVYWNGIVQWPASAGISLNVDTLCTALLWQMLDIHMKEMISDGSLDVIHEKYVTKEDRVVFGSLHTGYEAYYGQNCAIRIDLTVWP